MKQTQNATKTSKQKRKIPSRIPNKRVKFEKKTTKPVAQKPPPAVSTPPERLSARIARFEDRFTIKEEAIQTQKVFSSKPNNIASEPAMQRGKIWDFSSSHNHFYKTNDRVTKVCSAGLCGYVNPGKVHPDPSTKIGNLHLDFFPKWNELRCPEKFKGAMFSRKVCERHSDIIDDVFEKLCRNPDISVGEMKGVAIVSALAFSTQRNYWRHLKHIETYWSHKFPEQMQKLTFFGLAASEMCEHFLCIYMLYKAGGSKRRYAPSSIKKYRTSMRYLRRLLSVNPWQDTEGMSFNLSKGIIKRLCTERKVTPAIPANILRSLFLFIKEKYPRRHFLILVLSFLAGSRASEIIKLKINHVEFFDEDWAKPLVRVKFFQTKTHQRTKNDHHLITFYKHLPWESKHHVWNGYEILSELVAITRKANQVFLGPWGENSYEKRSRNFYAWFKEIKMAFKAYLWSHKKWDYPVELWRFHSIRTTLIGWLLEIGMTEAKIQLRVGHKFNSQVTRQTYAMNAFLTRGFNQAFDKIMKNNVEVTDLLGTELDNSHTQSPHFDNEAASHEAQFDPSYHTQNPVVEAQQAKLLTHAKKSFTAIWDPDPQESTIPKSSQHDCQYPQPPINSPVQSKNARNPIEENNQVIVIDPPKMKLSDFIRPRNYPTRYRKRQRLKKPPELEKFSSSSQKELNNNQESSPAANLALHCSQPPPALKIRPHIVQPPINLIEDSSDSDDPILDPPSPYCDNARIDPDWQP